MYSLLSLNVIKNNANKWLVFIILVFVAKISLFAVDPLPMFMMGDSHSYIATALTGWIPPDRSFTYGYFIRFTAVAAHSLDTLILIQVMMSGLNAIFLAYILNRFFLIQPMLSFFFGILCAVEPLQLLYERYVMTEALSLFLFVIYLLFIFLYLEKPRLLFLLVISILGTAVISVRLSFLPDVLVNSVILPFIAIPAICKSYSIDCKSLRSYLSNIFSHRKVSFNLTLHIFLSLGLTFSFHYAYKNLNGYLSEKPPAYQYQSGFFLITSFAPIIEPIDFPNTELADKVFGNLKYDLKNYHKRGAQHWDPGGLVDVLNRFIPDSLEADRIAKDTVINALRRNPFGLLEIVKRGFLDYLNINFLKAYVKGDIDYHRELPDYMLIKLRKYFSLYADNIHVFKTLTNKYYFFAWPWYLFLLCLPFFTLILLFICKRNIRKNVLVVFLVTAIIVAISCTLIERPTIRYLHPVGWLSFIVIGNFINEILTRVKSKKLSPSPNEK